jgi:hypothetical protein
MQRAVSLQEDDGESQVRRMKTGNGKPDDFEFSKTAFNYLLEENINDVLMDKLKAWA